MGMAPCDQLPVCYLQRTLLREVRRMRSARRGQLMALGERLGQKPIAVRRAIRALVEHGYLRAGDGCARDMDVYRPARLDEAAG